MRPLPPDCSSTSRWMVKRAAAKKVSRAKILIPVTFLSALSRYRQSSTNATTAIQFHLFYPFQWLLLQICNIWFISIFYFIFRCAVSFVNLSFTLVKVAPRYLYICLSLFLMFAYLQTWFGFGRLHEEGEGVRGGGGVTCGILVLVSKKVVRILVLVFEEGVKWDSSVWGFLTVTLDQARRRTHWSWKMLKDTHLDWWNAENQKELLWKLVLVKESSESLKGRGQSLSRGELKLNNVIHLLGPISWVICYWNVIAGWRVQEKSSKSTLVENILDYLVVGAGFEYPVDIFAKSGSIADRMAFILRSIPWYSLISAGS